MGGDVGLGAAEANDGKVMPAAVAQVGGADDEAVAAFDARGADGSLCLGLVPGELPFSGWSV